MNKIKTIARPAEKKVTGCGECRSTCQSACKTSCTVGNQSCERISRENQRLDHENLASLGFFVSIKIYIL